MKTKKLLFLMVLFTMVIQASAAGTVIEKKFPFTVTATGEKIFNFDVPTGAKAIRAVVSEQTEMVNLYLYGPTNELISQNSTWSYISNWKDPFKCTSTVSEQPRQKSGSWSAKVQGAVHVGKRDKIGHVSGLLTVFIEVEGIVEKTDQVEKQGTTLPIELKYDFKIGSREIKDYIVNVPKGAKKISARISGQSEMINLTIFGPTNVRFAQTSTWSYISNWKDPIKTYSNIVNNDRQGPGDWTVKIEGSVHVGKLDKIKFVTGTLTINIE